MSEAAATSNNCLVAMVALDLKTSCITLVNTALPGAGGREASLSGFKLRRLNLEARRARFQAWVKKSLQSKMGVESADVISAGSDGVAVYDDTDDELEGERVGVLQYGALIYCWPFIILFSRTATASALM